MSLTGLLLNYRLLVRAGSFLSFFLSSQERWPVITGFKDFLFTPQLDFLFVLVPLSNVSSVLITAPALSNRWTSNVNTHRPKYWVVCLIVVCSVAWQQVFDVDINYCVRDNVDVFRLQATGAERHHGSPSQGVRRVQKDEQNVSIKGPVCVCGEYWFNPSASEFFFFLILAHLVYKMWIIREPNKLALWNKLHFEEKRKRRV